MTAIYISTFAALVSLLSLAFAFYSWRQANRPLVTARVATATGGNQAITLNLLIENTGNRPARSIRLSVDPKALEDAMNANRDTNPVKDVERVFREDNVIPVLANGRSTSNAFGFLSQGPCTWRVGARLPITVRYRDLGRRRFCTTFLLVLQDDAGFAQTTWS
jgi:hypothetical protein